MNVSKSIIIFALFIALALPALASAQTENAVRPGTFFYFIDTTFEKVGLFFAFNPEKKAKKALEYADKRLAQIEAIDEENDSDAVETLVKNYETNIALAVQKSKEIADEEKAETLFNSIADNASKNQEVLSAVLVKVPEEAKEAIERAIEASKKNQEEALRQIAELKKEISELKTEIQNLKDELKEKEEQKIIKQEFKKENNDDELENLKKEIEKLEKEIKQPEIKETKNETKSEIPPVSPKTSEKQEFVKLKWTSPDGYYTNERIFFNPAINKQQVDDLVDSGWKIVDSHLSHPISFGTKKEVDEKEKTDTVSDKSLQITSVNVSSTLNSIHFEWETNKPSNSKIFFSGGGFSSKVFTSQSGVSTRHVVTITSLTSGTNYSYEIESIAGEEVAKKEGSFATKEDEFSISIEPDKTSVPASGYHQINLKVKVFKNGENQKGETIFMTSPDSGQICKQSTNNPGGSAGWYTNCYYTPKTVGTHTLEFSWNVVSGEAPKTIKKNIDIYATTHKKIDPEIINIVNSKPVFTLSNDGKDFLIFNEDGSIKNLDTSGRIGSFYLSEADEPISQGSSLKHKSEVSFGNPVINIGCGGSIKEICRVWLYAKDAPSGIHTITVKEITITGNYSGTQRNVQGLPVTFTFEVK